MTCRKQRPQAERGFASAAMVALVAHALRTRAPELLPNELVRLDPVREARCSLDMKRRLLESAYEALGSQFVFDIGQGIHHVGSALILQPFLRSEDGEVLFGKWTRLEGYGHSRHRTRVQSRRPGDYVLQRYSTTGEAPGAPHNLFVLGVLTAMLEAIGVAGLNLTLVPGERVFVQDGERLTLSDGAIRGDTDCWRLNWKAGEPSRAARVEDSFASGGDPLAHRISDLLSEDPSRSWSLAGLSEVVGLSTRSLQRRLSEEGTSYSEVVRTVRVGEASRLIEFSAYSMTEIGYLCGFADSAQFSRDFRASTGTTPSEFRSAVDGPGHRNP